MFGHDHKDEHKDDENTPGISTAPVNHGLLGIDDDDTASSGTPLSEPSAAPIPAPSATSDIDDVSTPTPTFSDPVKPVVPGEEIAATSTPDAPKVEEPLVPNISSSLPPTPDPIGNDDSLLDIKREALQELSPLIDHLDQNSEEKFRTTMMMIQASDNKELVPQAFEAARAITDDKKRAQALLDIVNEINYFTQKTTD